MQHRATEGHTYLRPNGRDHQFPEERNRPQDTQATQKVEVWLHEMQGAQNQGAQINSPFVIGTSSNLHPVRRAQAKMLKMQQDEFDLPVSQETG